MEALHVINKANGEIIFIIKMKVMIQLLRTFRVLCTALASLFKDGVNAQ